MLPKMNSLRTKTITVNTKEIVLTPWSNLQLINYEGLKTDELRVDSIFKNLIKPNIECKQPLTLIEEKIVLTELYKMSKSNIIDVVFTCQKCNNESEHSIFIDKAIKYKELKDRTIKTKNCIFNLRPYSIYRIDLNADMSYETIKYVASFIDSIDIDDKLYEGFEMDELVQWLINELDKPNFDDLLRKFDKIQPRIIINAEATCPYCETKQKLAFTGVDDFLE